MLTARSRPFKKPQPPFLILSNLEAKFEEIAHVMPQMHAFPSKPRNPSVLSCYLNEDMTIIVVIAIQAIANLARKTFQG